MPLESELVRIQMEMVPWTLLLLLAAASAAQSPPPPTSSSSSSSSSPIINFSQLPDDCPTSCGNISVEYPFGLKDGCFRQGFKLFCNTSTQPHKLFLGEDTTTQVFTQDLFGYFNNHISVTPLSKVLKISGDDPSATISWTGDGTPYAMSFGNVVTVVGCGVRTFLIDGGTNKALDSCTSTCTDMEKIVDGACGYGLGEGCCFIPFPGEGQCLKSYTIRISTLNSTQQSSTIVKILVYNGLVGRSYNFNKKDLYDTQSIGGGDLGIQAFLEWNIPDQLTCESAQRDKSNYACLSHHSKCYNSPTPGLGYQCVCQHDGDTRGNAYIPHGCRARCRFRICSKLLLGLIIGAIIGMALLLFTILTNFTIRKWKKIKQKRIREKHFHQNHGLLLQQLISSNEDIAERIQIFSLEEMEKATNNFAVTRIIGSGHCTAYKGILADQRVVAIKRSKAKIDQFINEVAILFRINHKNIVRFFGCCLEIEVPLLVYEFIPNETLYDHLHSRDANTTLSWEDRLRIATEVAAALVYLHCPAFISIFHWDIKSSNILLDDNLTAKVSDFGASKLISDAETHNATIVQGTYGYLDPQYYRTSELVEKSDVHNLGVILLELLTRKELISSYLFGEERNLNRNFLVEINENLNFDFVDARVQVEATKEELEDVAQLACECINFESNARPTMKEVEYRLQILKRKTKQIQKHKESEPLSLVSSNSLQREFMVSNSNQANEEASQNYSMEKYLMSTYLPH